MHSVSSASPSVVRLAATLGLAAALAACNSETGEGRAFGSLYVGSCERNRPYAAGSGGFLPDEYDLAPRFIAGEPLQDPRSPPRANRLVLRLQSSGKQVESNDVLTFDFVDSFEVARCLGGARRADGSADFDEGSCVPITRERDGALVPGALLRISPETPVRAYFMPRATCPATLTDPPRNYVATAVSTWPPGAPPPPAPPPSAPGGGSVPARPAEAPAGWASWLELVAFGKAQGWRGQPCRDDECVRDRRAFEIEFGDRVEATGFDLLMMDDRFVKRLRRGEPPGMPEILGRLVGEFELRLARGQGAQTFP